MEKIQETCKQACSYDFGQENHIKAHVWLYPFSVHLYLYIIMVKGPLCDRDTMPNYHVSFFQMPQVDSIVKFHCYFLFSFINSSCTL